MCPNFPTRWFLIALILFAGNAVAETIGGSTSDSPTGTSRSRSYWATSADTATATGTLVNGYSYLRMNDGIVDTAQIFIYTDNAGAPGTLLDTTAKFEVTTSGDNPYTLYGPYAFVGGATITAGAIYHIGVFCWGTAATMRVGRHTGQTGTIIRGSNGSDDAPLNSTAVASSQIVADNRLATYATTLEASGAIILLGGGLGGGVN